MKVERVSYDVPTPSAARGILAAIFQKPEFDFLIREIHVLKPISYFCLTRNEVKNKASYQSAKKARSSFLIEEQRTQRHSLILRDVAYIIKADQRLRPGVNEDIAKYRDQFRRRVNKGQCFWRPYLGCREFSAFFGPPEEGDQAIPVSTPLGFTLFDLLFEDEGKDRGTGTPIFFQAELERGVLKVPEALYSQTLKNKRSR